MAVDVTIETTEETTKKIRYTPNKETHAPHRLLTAINARTKKRSYHIRLNPNGIELSEPKTHKKHRQPLTENYFPIDFN